MILPAEHFWWVYSTLAALCFAGMVLSLKFAVNQTSSFSVATSLMGGLAVVFIIVWYFMGAPVPSNFYWHIAVVAILCSAIANLSDMTGIKYAPNPGYHGAIKNGQSIIITIFAWLFLSSVLLTLPVILCVLVVTVGIMGIVLQKKTHVLKGGNNVQWQFYSLISMVGFALVVLCARYIIDGFSSDTAPLLSIIFFNVVLWSGTYLCLLVWGIINKLSFKLHKNNALPVIGAILLAVLANCFDYLAVGSAPNPGYATAIKGTQTIPITILSFFLYKDVTLTVQHLVFILVTLSGVIGIVLLS